MAGRIARVLLVLLVMVLAAGAARLTGGRFSRLADNTLAGLHWLAAACIALFLRLNLRRPGVALLALGFAGNALVVALNGAMPVSATALLRAGLDRFVSDPRHELADASTVLPWLGDVVPVALPGLGQ